MTYDEHSEQLREIEALRERLSRAERERDEYQSQVHDLTERVARMTSAATSAAATAEAALGRLIAAQVIIDAAYVFADARPAASRELRELREAVALHRRGLPS